MIKEHYRGLSEGEPGEKMYIFKQLWRQINDTGYTYEELVKRGDIVPREQVEEAQANQA